MGETAPVGEKAFAGGAMTQGRGSLRVVFVTHVARFSGAEIKLARVIEAAGDRIEATVIVAEDGPLVQVLSEAGAQVEVMPLAERARSLKRNDARAGARQALASFDVARYAARLRRRLRELEPEAVGTLSLKAGIYGSAAARLAGLPVVWHLHDHLASDYIARQAVLPMRALVATLPSAVIAPSRVTLETVGWFRPGLRTAIVPSPVPTAEHAVAVRPHVQRVGMVGRLAPWKGQHVFLQAFAQAFPGSDVRAVVVGEATFGEQDYADQLQARASELGIADRVDFRGFRRDVQSEFQRLDLLVHASLVAEPFGMSIFEGMACGLPVIAADASGPAEYIDDGTNGLLHQRGNVDELAAVMLRAAGDFELRVRLGAAGRERVRAFAPEPVAQEWLELYADVVDRHRRYRSRSARRG